MALAFIILSDAIGLCLLILDAHVWLRLLVYIRFIFADCATVDKKRLFENVRLKVVDVSF